MIITRRIVPFLLTIVLLTTVFSTYSIAASFTDVNKDAYYYDAVEWGAKTGIALGTAPEIFSPDQPCTRAQILTFIWRAIGEPKPSNTNCPFVDVQRGSYYEQAVLWAVEFKITSGVSISKFAPDQVCTRAQAVTFLWRACGAPPSKLLNSFSDVSEEAYFFRSVVWASTESITNGTNNTLFSPDQICTRGQIITFLYRCEKNYGLTPGETPSYYKFYKEIVRKAEQEYGVAETRPYHTLTLLWGVGGIRLLDLNNDGIDELLLWKNKVVEEYNVPGVSIIEIWTIIDNSPVQLYEGEPYLGGDIGTTALNVTYNVSDQEWQVIVGQYSDLCNVDFYSIRNNQFVKTHYVHQHPVQIDGIHYLETDIDGNKTYSTSYAGYRGYSSWQILCNGYNYPQDTQDFLTATLYSKAKIGL